MQGLWALTVLAAFAACAPPGRITRATAGAPGTPEREVVGAVEGLFAAMRARDTSALRALLAPDLVVVASVEPAEPGGAPTVRRQSAAAFLAAVAASTDELRERMWDPEVRLDGAVATLWAPYDFHRGAQFSHCGFDSFQLVRERGRWVLTGLAYTVRRTGCTGPPDR